MSFAPIISSYEYLEDYQTKGSCARQMIIYALSSPPPQPLTLDIYYLT